MRKVAILFLMIIVAITFSYTLRVGDVIRIEVFGEPNFSKTVTVGPDGSISYPYAGMIKVAGLTVDQVKSIIEKTVSRFIKSPVVTVYIDSYSPIYVYLQGAINRAFNIAYLPNITLTKLFSHLELGVTSNIDFTRISVIRSGKATTYNILPFFYGEYISNDPVLNEGDIIYLPILTSDKKVQVSGAYTLDVPFEPGLTLRALLVKLGPLDKESAVLESSILFVDNTSIYVNLESVVYGKTNYMLKPGATLYIPKREERYVYIVGNVLKPGVVNFRTTEDMNLYLTIVKAGGIISEYEKLVEKIVITTPDGKSIEYTKDILNKAQDVKLISGSTVEIRRYPEFRVYLTGDFNKGILYFDPEEPKTLEGLLMKIDDIKTDTLKWIEKVTVNGKEVNLSKAKEINLSHNDVVEIKKYPEFRVYLTGDFNKGILYFDPEEPKTLEGLLMKVGDIKTDTLKWIEKVTVNGKEVNLSKAKEINLSHNDVVEIKKYPEFYVYVQGQAKNTGKISFEPQEARTLKMLIAKIGLPSDDVENEGKVVINGSTTLDIKDIIYGSRDYQLSLGDIIVVKHEPFIVQVVGLLSTGNSNLRLTYSEPKKLSYAIKKLGINQPEAIKKVEVIREGKEYEFNIDELIRDIVSFELNKYDTIVIKQSEVNAVYVTGDVASYVTFEYNEPITLHRIFSKIGLSDYRKIEKITINGKAIDFAKDELIEKGTILNIELKKPVYVTAMGYLRNTGLISFDYRETPDLQTLFAKLGGLIINPESYITSDKIYILRDRMIVETYDALEIFKGIKNAALKDGDFVYVSESQPKQVYVFGKTMPNGLIKFTQSEQFDLRTLIGKLGGLSKDTSKKINIISESGSKTIVWDEYTNMNLISNSIVLFDEDKENFVYVVKPDGTPEMLRADKTLKLYEVLSNIGLNKNYRKIEIISGENKQIIELKSIVQSMGYNVNPGDIVRIFDAPENYAFVFGEVNKPGIITLRENTTVLQAIIQAGYFNSKAVPSSVWLYKGGVNGQPVRVDLSVVTGGGKPKYDPVVEPGDVIYVPADMFKTALEWIPVINNLIIFYNNVTGLFK